MFDIKKIITKALLAVTFAMGASAAWAGPAFHVDVNTSQFAGKSGAFFLSFNSVDNATSAVATLSNFTGLFGGELLRSGDIDGKLPNAVVFGNSEPENSLLQFATLGGMFGFDIAFSGAFETIPNPFGALFGVALLDLQSGGYHGNNGNLLEFMLTPPGVVTVDNPTRIVNVVPLVPPTSVPEPSDLLLVMTGLGLVAFLRRRATKAAR